MNLLDMMNELGSRARYGVSPTDKYKLMLSGTVPGQPQPFQPGGAEVNPDAERYSAVGRGSGDHTQPDSLPD
jgi:hypothetical protein